MTPADKMGEDRFIGRRQELDLLVRQTACLDEGRGNFVVVAGEPGIGKSALIREAVERLRAARPGLVVHSATCHEQFDHGHPFLLFADLAEDIFTEQGALRASESYGRVLQETLGSWLQVVPVVGNLTAAIYETARSVQRVGGGAERPGNRGDAGTGTAEVLRSFTRLFRRLASEGPVVFVLDDLHWADPSSITLIGYMARQLVDVPLLIIGGYRPADAQAGNRPLIDLLSELRRAARIEQIELAGFDRASLAELVRTDRDLSSLLSRTGGNPLFALELSRLRDTEDLDLAALPSTIEGVLERRLERLEDDLKKALRYAAVVGDKFSSLVLSRLLESDEADLEDRLHDVQTVHGLVKELGFERLPGRQETSSYAFTHGLFQKRLYADLRRTRRRRLHRVVAEVLEELYPSGPARVEVRHLLIQHWRRAGEPDRAFAFALAETQRIADLGLYAETVSSARLASTLLDEAEAEPHDPRRLDLSLTQVRAVLGLGDRRLAESLVQEAAQIAERHAAELEPDHHVRLLLARADVLHTSNWREAALLRAAAVETAKDATPEARLRAMSASLDSRGDDAPPWLDEYVELIEAVPSPGEQVDALTFAACYFEMRGDRERAAAFADRARLIAAESGSPSLVGMELFARGFLALWRGDIVGSRRLFAEAAGVYEAPSDKAEAWSLLAMVEGGVGRPEALLYLQRALEATPGWNRPARIQGHCKIAEQLIEVGRPDEAQTHIGLAETLARASGDETLLSPVLRVRAILLRAGDREEEALDLLLRSEELGERWGDPSWDRHEEIAEVLLTLGRIAEATEHFEAAWRETRDDLEGRTMSPGAVLRLAQARGDSLTVLELLRAALDDPSLSVDAAGSTLHTFVETGLELGLHDDVREVVEAFEGRLTEEAGMGPFWVGLSQALLCIAGERSEEALEILGRLEVLSISQGAPWLLILSYFCREDIVLPDEATTARIAEQLVAWGRPDLASNLHVRVAASQGDEPDAARASYFEALSLLDNEEGRSTKAFDVAEAWFDAEQEWADEDGLASRRQLMWDLAPVGRRARLRLAEDSKEAWQRLWDGETQEAFDLLMSGLDRADAAGDRWAALSVGQNWVDHVARHIGKSEALALLSKLRSWAQRDTLRLWLDSMKADMHADLGELEEAIEVRRESLTALPDERKHERAVQRFRIALHLADLGRHADALPHFEAALDSPEALTVSACGELLVGLGNGLWRVARRGEALERWMSALDLAERSIAPDSTLAAAGASLGLLDEMAYEWIEERASIRERVERLGERRGWTPGATDPQWPLVSNRLEADQGVTAAPDLRTATEEAFDLAADQEDVHASYRWHRTIAWERGWADETLHAMTRLTTWLRASDSELLDELLLQADGLIEMGLADEASSRLTQAAELLDGNSELISMGTFEWVLQIGCQIHLLAGDGEAALSEIRQAPSLTDESENPQSGGWSRALLAYAAAATGEPVTATEALEDLLAYGHRVQGAGDYNLASASILAAVRGAPALADSLLERSQELVPSQGMSPVMEITVQSASLFHAALQGDPEAPEGLERAWTRGLLARTGSAALIGMLCSAHLAFRSGERTRALELVEQAAMHSFERPCVGTLTRLGRVLLPEDAWTVLAPTLEDRARYRGAPPGDGEPDE